MLKKYKIGPDHLVDYLEKKLLSMKKKISAKKLIFWGIPNFRLEETNIAALDDIKKVTYK